MIQKIMSIISLCDFLKVLQSEEGMQVGEIISQKVTYAPAHNDARMYARSVRPGEQVNSLRTASGPMKQLGRDARKIFGRFHMLRIPATARADID